MYILIFKKFEGVKNHPEKLHKRVKFFNFEKFNTNKL